MAKASKQRKRKVYARYGGYSAVIDGKLYAVVNIPLGNGKYRKKRKQVENKIEAKQWALEQLTKAKDGEQVFERKNSRLFSVFAKWYKSEFLIPPIYQNGRRLAGLRTYKQQRNTADRLVKEFGSYELSKISIDVLRRYKQKRLKTVSITSVNRDFSLMRSMLKKALRRHWINENPFDSGEKLIESALEAKRESKMTHRLAIRLLARSRKSEQPLLHYLIWVLMSTGARPSEIYPYQSGNDEDVPREPLIWQNILAYDFQALKLVAYKGKIRKERLVPATPELERILRRFYIEADPLPSDLLFPVTDFSRSWATLCRSVGVSGIILRDFRHYFNSRLLLMPDINDMERMKLLGHTKLATNAIYSRLDDRFIKKFRRVVGQPIIESDSVN